MVQGPHRVLLANTSFDNVTLDEAVARIDEMIRRRRSSMVVTANVDHLIRLQRDRDYAEVVRRADLILPDGQPIVWMSRLIGRPMKERVAGSDLFPRLCEHASKTGYRVFFLGGAPGSAEMARRVLEARFPGLCVTGISCPPFGFENRVEENRRIVEALRAAAPDLVFVGLGSPKQERWIADHAHEFGPAVSIGIGISFSFVSGHVKRAPLWLQRMGLEWAHRLWCEPRRLWRRYLIRGPAIVPILVREMRASRRHREAV